MTPPRLSLRRKTRRPDPVLGDRRGATAVEYGLILSLVVIAIIGAIIGLGNGTMAMWGAVNTKIVTATSR